MILAPSLLAADFSVLKEQVIAVEKAGCRYLHLDVMDGAFVPNLSFGPPVIKSLRPHTSMVFDCHLMIQEPDRYLDDFCDAGADRITVHQETCPHLHRTIQAIKERGRKAGVSLNPSTSLETLRYVLSDVDMVLIMSVNPGFGGQQFIPAMLPKIRELRLWIEEEELEMDIQVDGGITAQNIGSIAKAGANIFVAGSSIFGKGNIQKAVADLEQALDAENSNKPFD